jgi:hypothetical protein
MTQFRPTDDDHQFGFGRIRPSVALTGHGLIH